MQGTDKTQLRKYFLTMRQGLKPPKRHLASHNIRELFLSLPEIAHIQSILLYFPTQNEVDTKPLFAYFWQLGVQVLLPRCHDHTPGQMDIHEVHSFSELGPGRFGLQEPLPALAPLVVDPRPNIIVVPGLAFDRQGLRLGFGGGYYDRFLPTQTHPHLRVGLAYAFQLTDKLPTEPWDMVVQRVITPDAVIVTET